MLADDIASARRVGTELLAGLPPGTRDALRAGLADLAARHGFRFS